MGENNSLPFCNAVSRREQNHECEHRLWERKAERGHNLKEMDLRLRVPYETGSFAMNKQTEPAIPVVEPEGMLPTRWSLIGRLKNWDDQESWRDFFETYWRLIYGVALKSGLTHAEAEEVVQETVVSVCRKMGEFKADPAHGSFKSWLLQLTRWRITDQLRKRPARQDHPGASQHLKEGLGEPRAGVPEDLLSEAASGVLDAIWDEEWENHVIEAALEKLKKQVSARQFQVFYLHVIKQLPAPEAARALRVQLPQVYLTKHRLKPLFQKAVQEVGASL